MVMSWTCSMCGTSMNDDEAVCSNCSATRPITYGPIDEFCDPPKENPCASIMEMNYKAAVAKIDMGKFIAKGDKGLITAYLPEMETFAIFFGKGRWFTLSGWAEEDFLNHFEVLD